MPNGKIKPSGKIDFGNSLRGNTERCIKTRKSTKKSILVGRNLINWANTDFLKPIFNQK